MAPVKFAIPLQRKDLLRSNSDNSYMVENEYSIRELKTKLVDVQVLVNQKGCQFVLEGGFDVIFSVLDLANKDLPEEYKSSAFEILATGMDDLIRHIDVFLGGNDLSNEREKHKLSTKMKMNVYLMSQLAELIETDVQQKESANVAIASKKGQKKKVSLETWSWDEKRLEAITLFFRLMSLNINALFEPPIIEEELVNLVGNCVFRIFENPSIALQRLKDTRSGLTQVLGMLISKHGYGLSCRLKMVQGLKHFEHLAGPMAESVEKLTLEYHCRGLVMDIVREITRLDVRELSRDTSGTRTFSQFLVEISERIPDQLQPCLSLLQLHLDGDSYMLRKSILSIFMEIVLRLYSSEALDEAAKETRDQYLDCLEDHVHDVHAHVRSSVLQSWTKLCVSKAIPLNRQLKLLKLIVGRLRDRSSNVRKQAVQLLTHLLQNNPYNSSLPAEEIREQYEKEKATLDELLPKDMDAEEAQKVAEEKAKQWSEIEKELKEFEMEEENKENHDDLWENASPGEVHERIRHHLTQHKLTQALSLLEAAKAEFPVFKNLENEGQNEVIEQLRTIYFMPLFRETAAAMEAEKAKEKASEENEELKKQTFLVNYLKDSLAFTVTLNEALPTVCTLLGSKQISDVQEAINFFVTAFEFGLLNAMLGVRKMLSLIFSREQNVQAAVVAAYKRLYIESAFKGSKVNNVELVRNLCALVSGASIGDLAGLEELIGMLVKSKELDKNSFQVMWQFFTKVIPETTNETSRCALILIGMVGSIEPSLIMSNVNILVEHGLENRDLKVAHDACLALTKISNAKPSGPDQPPFKLAPDHELFSKLEKLLVDKIDNKDDDQYIPMAQQAISVLYQLSDNPDVLGGKLCQVLSQKMKNAPKNGLILRRSFFVVGHIAVCQLNHLDCQVFGELKRRNALRELTKEKERVKAKTKANKRRVSAFGTESPRTARASLGSQFNDDDDMGVVGAEADDAEAEYIRNVCEKELVTGSNLLALFAPAIMEVCLYQDKYPDPKLRASASLALAKFMLVSSEFCDEQLQLLFTVLERSPEPVIRANMIIAAGDLSFRFPNTLEPWTPRMYACLRDDSSLVRSNTVTVLTHLILNDMIKVKGQISDMALCIMDECDKIGNMAKLFFTELSRKGNALYNVMPDIVSRLSDPAAGIDEDKFKEIMRYIIGLIDKDKHLESLVEKLCHRFHATTTERQWRDLAFCLSIFNYNEKAAKKFMDNFSCYADKLHEDVLYEAVTAILTQCKKLPKAETKVAVDELATKVEEARDKAVEDHTAGTRAKKATTTKKSSKTPLKAKKVKAKKESSDEEDDDESDIEEALEGEIEEKENMKAKMSDDSEDDFASAEEEMDENEPVNNKRPKPQKSEVKKAGRPKKDSSDSISPPKSSRSTRSRRVK